MVKTQPDRPLNHVRAPLAAGGEDSFQSSSAAAAEIRLDIFVLPWQCCYGGGSETLMLFGHF
jgi:hypothetical protein